MKLTLFISFFLFCFSLALAQQQAAIWYFGKNAGLDFRSGNPVALLDGQIDTWEGCSTISDDYGNLLFYSDGSTVFNKNHKVMENGEGLLGYWSSTQSAIIIPNPHHPNLFYIFTISWRTGLYYSEVNMDLENGLGAVTGNKNILLASTTTEKVTAVRHANGKDLWVISHEAENDTYITFLVNSVGVNEIPVKSNAGLYLSNWNKRKNNNIGYLKASPDGKKLGVAHWMEGVEILDFNDSTGEVSNPLTLVRSRENHYGIEFSPNSQVLYTTTEKGKILQYDLNASNIPESAFLIYDSAPFVAAVQVAIDGKIYLANRGKFLDVINNPDVIGAGCNFIAGAVDLKGRNSIYGLPQFIQSNFKKEEIIAENLCQGGSTSFLVEGVEPPNSITWDFGDGSTASGTNVVHTYAAPGEYTVKALVRKGGVNLPKTKEITIYQTPEARELQDIAMCSNDTGYNFNLFQLEPEILGDLSSENFLVSFHSSLIDAEININALPSSFSSSRPEEEFFVRVHNKENQDCFDITDFRILFNKMPVLREITDVTICGGGEGSGNFDLSAKTEEALKGQNTDEFSVSWFESQEDADQNKNPVPSLYSITSPVQDLYFRIYNSTTPQCYQSGSFQLEVLENVNAHSPTNYAACEDNTDGFFQFDLSTKDAEILNGQNSSYYNITYHITASDAEEEKNALPLLYTNTTAFSQPVFARVENKQDNGCFEVTSFDLQVTAAPEIREVTNWQVCDEDGMYDFDLTVKYPEILGNQDAGLFTISHYLTAEDAENKNNPLPTTWQNSAPDQQLFYRLENRLNPNCYVTGSYFVEVTISPEAKQANSIVICDTEGTGSYMFDLSAKDAEVLGQQDPEIYTVSYYSTEDNAVYSLNPLNKKNYTHSSPEEVIFARVDSQLLKKCYDISSFSIIANKIPVVNLLPEYVICLDANSLKLDGGAFNSWEWTNESGTVVSTERFFKVKESGFYMLTVNETKHSVTCENSTVFEVLSTQVATDFTFVAEHFSKENKIVLTVDEPGDFEYSLDGRNFIKENIFYVSPGIYTAYVRDTTGCRTLTKQVEVMGKMEFFTPNGDGFNDYWKLTGMGSNKDYSVFIFDRYGKLLKQLSPGSNGWDGTFNGRLMPAEDYWFTVELGDGRIYKNHFSLLR